MKNKVFIAVVVLVVLAGVILAANKLGTPGTTEELTELEAVQVRDYEGQRLSSISDFRENSIKGPQHVDAASYRLRVTGLVENSGEYTYDDIISNQQRYKKAVTLDCVEGWSVKILWEGVLVRDLIDKAMLKPNAKVVILRAYDGYSTSFPVDYIMNNSIVMAYKMNDVTIPPERGFPFQLVAESKWGYKWIKWITEIDLSDDVDFRGFWESRGYSHDGDLSRGFFERR
ncbi:MAG: molybdopterin-dependent oxidoreductase [Chloroflexota bacterium]